MSESSYNLPNLPETLQTLLSEIFQLTDAAKQRAAVTINSEITLLYWQVGDR